MTVGHGDNHMKSRDTEFFAELFSPALDELMQTLEQNLAEDRISGRRWPVLPEQTTARLIG